MADLSVTYLGKQLSNPLIAGASELSASVDGCKRLEDAGAGAVVAKSLFEEEIQMERFKLGEDLAKYNYRNPEMIEPFLPPPAFGPEEHLAWVRKAKESLGIPLIASLNAVEHDTWVSWARQLEQTGADALELNFYHVPADFRVEGSQLEREQLATLRDVRSAVSMPLAVKLSASYTNPLNLITRMQQAGVQGFVLFNRLFQPDIDAATESDRYPHNLSSRTDNRLPLRFAGLLHGNLDADICCSTGIVEADDVAKMVLAGATCVQLVTALYRKGVGHVRHVTERLGAWMDGKGYRSLDDFRGKLSGSGGSDPWRYSRAQYVRALMNPTEIVGNSPVL